MNTMATALARAERTLRTAGVETPRLDAEILLARALGVTRTALLTRLREALAAPADADFDALIARRRRREPVAYIEGGREFWSRWFEVDRHTLVPRPETETLVDIALARLAAVEAPRVLEIGTGSGCIAVTLACERRDAHVTAIDVSAEVLNVARHNAERWGVADRVNLIRADVRAFGCLDRFDLVVSNPPYARRGEIDGLMPEVAAWEPRGALDGGDDGLEVVRAVLALAAEVLDPAGTVAVEIGCDQGVDALELARLAGFEDAAVANDIAGLPRVLWSAALRAAWRAEASPGRCSAPPCAAERRAPTEGDDEAGSKPC